MKKTYKLAGFAEISSGYALLLDGKPALTPTGWPIVLPTEGLAEAVAREWQAQAETVRSDAMPLTRIAFLAMAMQADEKQKTIHCEQLLAYGETDLVCYRAGDSAELFHEQAELLDPILAWAERRFGITLTVTDGVMPVKQQAGNRLQLAQALSHYDEWKLAALFAATGALGSLVIALALAEGHIDSPGAFRLSHLEEAYETRKWGGDEEKEAKLKSVREAIAVAGRFLTLLKKES